MPFEELFRERLRSLKLGDLLHRPPARDTSLSTEIGQPAVLYQPGLLPCHAQVDMVFLHPRNEFGQAWDIHLGGQRGDGITSRIREEFVLLGRFAESGDECVLTAAFAGDKDFHDGEAFLSKSARKRKPHAWGDSKDFFVQPLSPA